MSTKEEVLDELGVIAIAVDEGKAWADTLDDDAGDGGNAKEYILKNFEVIRITLEEIFSEDK